MHVIECELEQGSVSGYVVDANQVNIQNYLEQHTGMAKAICWKLQQRREVVALLRNIYVEPEYRGQGIGSALVNSFMEEAQSSGATCILLICDEGEEQANGLSLQAWYENFGLCAVVGTESGPCMAMPDALVEDLSDYLGPSEDHDDGLSP